MKTSVPFFGQTPVRQLFADLLARMLAGASALRRVSYALLASCALAATAHAIAPTVTGVDVPANGSYPAGVNLEFAVFFSQIVTATGTPRIAVTLDTGGVVYANYYTGTGSTTLRFRYLIASGNSDPNGIVLGGAIDLNAGTIQNGGAEAAVLTLNNVGVTTGILIDAIPLTITSVNVPAGGIYKAGANLDFTVNFSKPAIVGPGNAPFIPITLDSGGFIYAYYLSGSGTTQLIFRFTVAVGDSDPTGIVLASAIDLNGSTIRDATLNLAVLTLVGVGGTNTIVIDGVAPYVLSANRVGATSTKATNVAFIVTFNEAVTGVDLSDFTLLKTGTATGTLSAISAVGTTAYQLSVTGVGGDGTLAISLNASGTGILDVVGNPAVVGYAGGQDITIDNTVPTLAISAPSVLDTDSGPVSFTIAYTGAEIISLSPSDVTIDSTGSAFATVQITGSGLLTRVVTLTNVTGAGTLGITLAAGTASDIAGNVALGAGPSTLVATNQAPVLFAPIQAQIVGYKTPFTYVVPASTFIEPNTDQTLTYSASGMPSGITFDPLTRAFGGIAAIGTSQVTVTATDNGVPARSTHSVFTLSVIKAVLTVKADNKSRPYGSTNPPLTYTLTGFVAGETLATSGVTGAPVLATVAPTLSDVNTFPITIVAGDLAAENYSFNLLPGTLTVSKAPLTVTADNKTRAYNTINPPLTVSITGFVNGETASLITGSPTLTADVSATNNVGSYPIVVGVGTLAASNYAFTNLVNGTLTVTPAPLSITLEGLVRVYNGSPQPLSASTTPSGSPLNFTYDGSATAPTNAGSYAVTGTSADLNFAGTASGTLVIAKAPQTITFALPAVTIGTPVALFATATSGLPVTFSVVTGNATIVGNSLTVADTSVVTVRATQAGTSNYSVATLDRTAGSVSRLSQTITFAAVDDKQADSPPFAITASASSNLPVVVSIVSGPAQIAGNTVTLTGSAGNVVVRLTQAGNATYDPAVDVTFSILVAPSGNSANRIINVSARAKSNGADNPLISGFIVTGVGTKPILIRGIGPGLTAFGVDGVLAKPTLQLYSGSTKIAENTGWTSGGNTAVLMAAFSRLGAFPLETSSADSAFLVTLAPGAYSMVVTGGTGIALAEVYDASINPQTEIQRLVNVSIRSEAGSGSETLICGFAITGNSTKRVLIRGIGPALLGYGVSNALADTRLRVYSGGSLLGENDNWSTVPAEATALAQAALTTGAFALPAGSKDSAIIMNLAPGAYSAQVNSIPDTVKGVALIEIYELP